MSTQPPFIVVDGSSYLYRAFHAMPPLTNSAGEPTGALYGVINMLRRLLNDYQPTQMAVVFDAKGKNFRHQLYADYKATRPPMPEELRAQIQPLHAIVKAMGLPLLMIDGVEADDVIATLAHQANHVGLKTVISTGDKDMAQCVTEHITLVNTMSSTLLDSDGVMQKFGVRPEQMIDYLALVGDKVDNVPGVEKCGPKTAVKWLKEYDSLDNLLANAEKITGKIGQNLRLAASSLPLSKQLVTVKTDVEIAVTLTELIIASPNISELQQYYKRFEFNAWLNELSQPTLTQPSNNANYECVLTEPQWQHWLLKLQQAALISFDTETTSLNYIDAVIVGFSVCVNAGEAAYVPLRHNYIGAPTQLNAERVLSDLKPILENDQIKKVGQHLKYDMNVLKQANITLRGIAYDTMLESYCYNSIGSRHDMDTLAQTYLGKSTIHYEEVAGKGVKQITFDQVDIDTATQYAAEDADITLQLHQCLWPKLTELEGPKEIFTQLEVPLIPILSTMECHGVLLDSDKLSQLSVQFSEQMEQLQQQAYRHAGQPFNLESPKQLQEILYNKMQLPILKKTPKGQPSTAEPILQELAHQYELPAVIIQYRTLSKLKSTYTDKLPLMVNQQTGRVHSSFNQTIASTGRLSSSDPNLQNIPVRNPQGRAIRSAFIAPANYKLVSADYSQIELRIMAHLSQDTTLLNAFAEGLDIHKATASEVFGISLDSVTDDQRRKAKAINFGLIYGMSAFGLAKQIEVPRHEAQAYIDCYFDRYPGVKQYMDDMRRIGHERGYVETIRGRRLYLPEINSKNKQRQMAAERIAINAPMQGTAADIIKQAMLDVDAWLSDSQIDAKVILQVHDELILEVAQQEVAQVKTTLPKLMQQAANLTVPLIASVGVGNNWEEAH